MLRLFNQAVFSLQYTTLTVKGKATATPQPLGKLDALKAKMVLFDRYAAGGMGPESSQGD